MNTQNIENALNGLNTDQLEAIYQRVNWWDGSFSECVVYELPDMVEMLEHDRYLVCELVKLGEQPYYYLDSELEAYESVGDYLSALQDNIVDLADYIGDEIGCWIDTDGEIGVKTFDGCPDDLPDSVKRALIIDVLADQGVYDLPDSQIDDLIDQF